MTHATTAPTSQDALNAVLGDAMPSQGCWSDKHYLWLTDRTRRLIRKLAVGMFAKSGDGLVS